MEKLTTEKLWLNFTNFTTFDKLPFIVASGNGTYVYDTSKKKYLDIISGIWNAGLGYSRQDIIDEMNYQMNKLPLTSLFGRAYPLLIEYSEKLLKLAPEFSKVFYGTGGSDSVETALKVARLFYYEQQKYKKVKIGHFAMSYHGVSLGAMNVMGEEPNREGCVLDIENYFTLPLPDNNDGDNVFRELDKLNSEEISAIIIEPIIGSGGIIEFPKEFLTLLREYTKNNDILLIFDEVVTGFGRTGSMFAYQGLEIVPDILVLAKNITAGYAPLGATLFSDTIVSIFKNKKLLHGYTNAGSVVGVAAANKVLDIFESDDAVCYYEIKTNRYIILYNDLDLVKMNCFRYRFSIAHELGHIFLRHLNDERSRIFRGSFSKKEYDELEEEADQFAAYILCPYAAFTDLEVLSVGRLSSICHLSKFASERRYAEYMEWFNNKTLTGAKSIKFDWFDILLRKKFAVKRYCQKCKRVMDFDNYCKICGDRLDLVPLVKEENNMIYSNIEINENHKAVKCPQCENEHSV